MRIGKALGICVVVGSCLAAATETNAQREASPVSLASLKDLSQHVGEYPCRNGILNAPILRATLRNVLGSEYAEYGEHIGFSGCGAIERRGSYLLMDVSQEHVGGYTSIILIRESDSRLFLLWLKTTVADRKLKLYSDVLIDSTVLKEFSRAMNVAWGHVACFIPEGKTLRIDTSRRANQDTGECSSR